MGNEKRDQPWALAVRWLLALGDGRRAPLAARAGISVSTLRRYEKGETKPRRRDLEALATAAGLPVPLEVFLSWCQTMFEGAPATEVPGRPRELDFEDSAMMRLVQAIPVREMLAPADRVGAVERARCLFELTPEERGWLLDGTLEYRSWAVAEQVCLESRRRAEHDPREALELAELAVAIAELSPGEPVLRWRVQGLALFAVAHAWRACGNLPEARKKWNEGQKLWRRGAMGDPGFEEALARSLEI